MKFHFLNPQPRLHLQQTWPKRYPIKRGHWLSPTPRQETPFPIGFQEPPLGMAKLNLHATGRLALPGSCFLYQGRAQQPSGASLFLLNELLLDSWAARLRFEEESWGAISYWGTCSPQMPAATEKQFHFHAPQTNCELSDFATPVPWFSMAEVTSSEEGKVPGSHLSPDSSPSLSHRGPSRPTGENSRMTQPPHSG